MALMNLKGMQKQKVLAPAPGVASPFAPTGATPPVMAKPMGLLKTLAPRPSQSTEVQKMPSLMKRLTGK